MEIKLQELRERLWVTSAPSRPNVRCSTCGSVIPLRTQEKDATEWNDAFNALIDLFAEKDAEIARLTRMIQTPRIIEDEFEDKG
jgi:hypothetical protein